MSDSKTNGTFLAMLLAAFLVLWGSNREALARPRSELVQSHNALVSANTEMLTTDFQPDSLTESLNITVGCVTTAASISWTQTPVGGGTTREFEFNSGTDLTPGVGYTFSLDVDSGFVYNFESSALTTVVMSVREVRNDRR